MKPTNGPLSRMVYSTQHGRICPTCEKPAAACTCRGAKPTAPSGGGIVSVGCSTKGRRGKRVTVVAGVPLAADGLQSMARSLKQSCGSGGTVKDGVIEIQGDHRDTIAALLATQGYTVKRSGG